MKLRTILLGLSALFIAVAAAYFSVTGLSKLFAGASTAVILMASSLEFGKLISASFLYAYWDRINIALRSYLLIGVVILILITSAGIYGFLTSAYQTTADQLKVIDKQTEVLELKKSRFKEQLDGYTKEKSSLTQTISDLSKGLSNNVIQYRDKDGNLITSTSSANRKAFEKQLDDAKKQRDFISSKIETLSDSISKLDLRIIDVSANNDLAQEVGPLKYMAEVTGKPMSTIVNWFALFIVFVFDPLAVTLVIAFNTALKYDKGETETKSITIPTTPYKMYGDKPIAPPIAPPITPSVTPTDDYFDDLDDITNADNKIIYPTILTPTPTIVSESMDIDPELASLKRDMSKRAIDVDGDGSVDGYDYDGDGLIDRFTNSGNLLGKNERMPYYARPEFDWNDKTKWINDQNAVNYWLTHKKF